MSVSTFLEAFIQWASRQPEIEAVALVGSHARGTATEDSDVDLVILTFDVEKYLQDRSWLALFGRVVKCEQEDYGRVTSLRVFYHEGLEVEYGLTAPSWADVPIDVGTLNVVTQGMRVLYDPHAIVGRMQREY